MFVFSTLFNKFWFYGIYTSLYSMLFSTGAATYLCNVTLFIDDRGGAVLRRSNRGRNPSWRRLCELDASRLHNYVGRGRERGGGRRRRRCLLGGRFTIVGQQLRLFFAQRVDLPAQKTSPRSLNNFPKGKYNQWYKIMKTQ